MTIVNSNMRINESGIHSLEPLPNSQASLPTLPQPPARRNLLIIISVVAIAICACGGIAAFTIGRGILGITAEQTAMTPVLDQFMRAMVARDVTAAYALFSARAQRQTPIADLTALDTGANYVLFEGYQSLTIDSTNITNSVNTSPDQPQGQVATISGTITYANTITGSFRATLEKEAGTWRLDAINITVPPSKTVK
jgi:hypothetical protein